MDSKKITDIFPTNEVADPNTDNDDPAFDDIYDSNNDNDNEFTLESLDLLLKRKNDDLWLRTVSQFLHLVQDQGFTKMDTSNFLAQSLNKGPW